MIIQYRFGDLWAEERTAAKVTVITTNGFIKQNGAIVMGRGIAKQARDSIPGIDRHFGALVAKHGNRPLRLAPGLWTMPVKHYWKGDASLDLIRTSAELLAQMVNKFKPDVLRMPKPGCGNGGRDWITEVRPILDSVQFPIPVEIWDFVER